MKPLTIGGIIAIVVGVIVAFSVSSDQTESQSIESKVLGEVTQSEGKTDSFLISDAPSLPVDTRILANEIHTRTNKIRVQNGLDPLEWNDGIAVVAQGYSQRMFDFNFYDHNDKITNESPADRGIKNGYPDCGDPTTIQLGKDIDMMQLQFNSAFNKYEKKVDRYNYLVEYYNTFGKDNISVYNEMVALQKELTFEDPKIKSEKARLDNMIEEFNRRVDNDMIFDGFGENLMSISGDISVVDVANETVTGWMNSPGHRDVLLTEAWTQEGIGVAISPDRSIIVTANYC